MCYCGCLPVTQKQRRKLWKITWNLMSFPCRWFAFTLLWKHCPACALGASTCRSSLAPCGSSALTADSRVWCLSSHTPAIATDQLQSGDDWRRIRRRFKFQGNVCELERKSWRVSTWWADDHIVNVVIVMCHLRDRIEIARLPGTRGSDPSKISLAFHQGNDCNLLHSQRAL